MADLGTGAQAWSAHQAEDRVERGVRAPRTPHARTAPGPRGGTYAVTLRLGISTTALLTCGAGEILCGECVLALEGGEEPPWTSPTPCQPKMSPNIVPSADRGTNHPQ